MRLPFTKMQGLSNDFVIIDERKISYNLTEQDLKAIADRRIGVGCDQVLIIRSSNSGTVAASYFVFNSDGSRAGHCGNGLRCVARYLSRLQGIAESIWIEVGENFVEAQMQTGSLVRVSMGPPEFEPKKIPLKAEKEREVYTMLVNGERMRFGAVSVGNPHAVIKVDDVDFAKISEVGSAVQRSRLFPEGVNVGFAQIVSPTEIHLRVFERGAGETPACGTGACGAVAVCRKWRLIEDRVNVELPGGKLTIEWDDETADSIWMTGPAEHVFTGEINL